MKSLVPKNLKYLSCIFVLNSIFLKGEEKPCCNEKASEPQVQQQNYILTIRDELIAAKAQGYTITPDAGPIVKGGVDMYAELDYIYSYVDEGGLAYAQRSVPEAGLSNASNTAPIPRPVVRPSFTFSSRFKAGLGVDTDYDGWG